MADLPSANTCTQSSVKKTRERKPNFSEAEINVLQDEVEKNYAVINDKFGSAVTNKRKTAVWGRISMMVTSLGVAHRSAKECKDKWGSTKKEAKKIFSVKKRTIYQFKVSVHLSLEISIQLCY